MPKKIKIKAKKTPNQDAAFQYYQSGNLQQAEAVCRQILDNKPDNSDAWHLLGMIALRGGRNDIAIQHISKAIQMNPNNHSFYHDLGLSLMINGAQDEAIRNFSKTLELKPDHAGAHFQTCFILQQQNRLEEAAKSYEQAIMFQPNNAEVHNNMGSIFMKQNKIEAAINSIKRALALKPTYAEAYVNLGIALIEKGLFDEAIENCNKAIELDSGYAEAYLNLGNAIIEKGLFDEAIVNYNIAIELDTGYSEAYVSLGNALREKGLLDDSADNYKKALTLKPDIAEAYNNLGAVLIEKGQLDDAIRNIEKALNLWPNSEDVYNNLGFAFVRKGMLEEAIDAYKKALTFRPDFALIHNNLGITYLLSGDFAKGWKEYEWRQIADKYESFPGLGWDGSPLGGRTLLINAEQGVGDEIMYASCLPDVISKGGSYVLECDRRLMPLFSRSFHGITIIRRPDKDEKKDEDMTDIDLNVFNGSLPLYFRPDLSSFPQQKSYLIPDKQKVEIWRERFKELGEGLKVGISWRGGRKADIKRMRSITLEQCAGPFSITEETKKFRFSKIYLMNLQYGDCSEEIQEFKEKTGITVHDWEDADPMKDLDNFAAQIAALDLVVSVDNSTVHIAGALGVPVWALLPFACDWRWMQDFEDTPWYESVRLYRQRSPGEWDGVLERVESDLKEYVSTGVMPGIDEKYSYKKTGKA